MKSSNNIKNLCIWKDTINKDLYQIDFTMAPDNEKDDINYLIKNNKRYKLYKTVHEGLGYVSCINAGMFLANYFYTRNDISLKGVIVVGAIGVMNFGFTLYNEGKDFKNTKIILNKIESSRNIKIKKIEKKKKEN